MSLVASYIDNRLDETNYAFNPGILSTEALMPRTLPSSLLALNASAVLSRSWFLEAQYSQRRFTIEQGGPGFSDRIQGTHIVDQIPNRHYGAPQFGGQPPNQYDNDTFSVKASNPGYAKPLGNVANLPGTVYYLFTEPGAYRTDNVTHTDLALDWAMPVYRGAEIFVHGQVFNVFNERGVVAVSTTVHTARDDSTLAPFNPFTDTPKAGVNYRLDPNFGKPTSSAGYQPPRTFQLGVGLRF